MEYIEAQQSQLEAALGGCQGLVQHDGRRSAADIDRDRAYTLAERLNKQLDAMGSQLESIFDGIAKKPTDNALDTITSILGQHLISLEWLEKQASEMESKLETLGQLESTAKQQAQRIHQ